MGDAQAAGQVSAFWPVERIHALDDPVTVEEDSDVTHRL